MKIAIPIDENKEDTSICTSFGRAPLFLLHNTETQTSETLKNPAADATGGAGVKAAQFLIDQGADILLTLRGGENAAEVLLAADVQVYKAQAGLARDNLTAFMEGKLDKLNRFHAGFHHKQ